MMTGIAVLQCHCEITQPARVDMALYTDKTNMLASDFERENIMIEFFSQAVHAIMAIETNRTKGQCVRGHEPQIHLTVAGIAGVQREGCDIAMMTVSAGERIARSR